MLGESSAAQKFGKGITPCLTYHYQHKQKHIISQHKSPSSHMTMTNPDDIIMIQKYMAFFEFDE